MKLNIKDKGNLIYDAAYKHVHVGDVIDYSEADLFAVLQNNNSAVTSFIPCRNALMTDYNIDSPVLFVGVGNITKVCIAEEEMLAEIVLTSPRYSGAFRIAVNNSIYDLTSYEDKMTVAYLKIPKGEFQIKNLAGYVAVSQIRFISPSSVANDIIGGVYRPYNINIDRPNGRFVFFNNYGEEQVFQTLPNGIKRKGTTSERPDGSILPIGFVYIDETLGNKPIYWTGDTSSGKSGWVDSAGNDSPNA